MIGVNTAADVVSARTVLDVDVAGTDNSTDVTLANVNGNYLSINGQEITVGVVPISLGGTGASTAAEAASALGLGTGDSPIFTNITSSSAPTAATHVATKAYVDGLVQGLDVKQSVSVATTENITLTNTQTVDGVAIVAGDRVLVKNQTNPVQNGIWVVVDGGSWTRSSDSCRIKC